MKNTYIRINSIEDIDLARVSVYDMNNRYIDSRGVMFGLRYNKREKRVEAVRLLRAFEKEAATLKYRLMRQKKTENHLDPITPEAVPMENDNNDPEKKIIDIREFVENKISLMHTHAERLKGIVMNIRNSNVFSKDNKAEHLHMENVFRNIEIEALKAFDNAENYHRELMSYPRSITYYQSKIDDEGSEIIAHLSGNNERIMRFIYAYEMHDTIKTVYRNLGSIISALTDFLYAKNLDEDKALSSHEKKTYKDAMTSIENTIQEIDSTLDELSAYERYIRDPDNF